MGLHSICLLLSQSSPSVSTDLSILECSFLFLPFLFFPQNNEFNVLLRLRLCEGFEFTDLHHCMFCVSDLRIRKRQPIKPFYHLFFKPLFLCAGWFSPLYFTVFIFLLFMRLSQISIERSFRMVYAILHIYWLYINIFECLLNKWIFEMFLLILVYDNNLS